MLFLTAQPACKRSHRALSMTSDGPHGLPCFMAILEHEYTAGSGFAVQSPSITLTGLSCASYASAVALPLQENRGPTLLSSRSDAV